MGDTKSDRVLAWILFLFYLCCVLEITLFSRTPSAHKMMLTPFWEYRELLTSADKLYWFQQITCNILMLMPMGAFLKIIDKRLNIFHAGLTGFMFSCWIELTQYFTGRGLLEFDDVFHNTLGAVIGYFLIETVLAQINKMR